MQRTNPECMSFLFTQYAIMKCQYYPEKKKNLSMCIIFQEPYYGDYDEEAAVNSTLELPPEIDGAETAIFNSDPERTLDALQRELEEKDGRLEFHVVTETH